MVDPSLTNEERTKQQDFLSAELSAIKEEAEEWIEKLQDEPKETVGVQILELFALDLMGRDSKKAKVFLHQQKLFNDNVSNSITTTIQVSVF